MASEVEETGVHDAVMPATEQSVSWRAHMAA